MDKSGDNVEAVVATEVPEFAIGRLVLDDDGASERAEWSGIKAEGEIVGAVRLINWDYQAKGPRDPFEGTNTHFHIPCGTFAPTFLPRRRARDCAWK